MKTMAGFTLALASIGVASAAGPDFGQRVELYAKSQSRALFGTYGTLNASSTQSLSAAAANAAPTTIVTLAPGLSVRAVSALPTLPPNIDQMALWPNDAAPTHLIACNEEGPAQAGVLRISITTGAHETILSGLSSCDPVRRTTWGTILAGEEAGASGRVVEIMNPLATTGVQINRVNNALSGANAGNVAVRTALGSVSFEGLAVLPNGVVYFSDERRPGNGNGGGAFYKFIPANFWSGGTLQNLANSPLATGTVYGLRLGARNGNSDFGPGTNSGRGTWVNLNALPGQDLNALAVLNKLTTYYRPEDLDVDQRSLAAGQVRFCGPNTGEELATKQYGEVVCITDGTLLTSASNTAVPELQYLVIGNPELAMPDNIAYQPGRQLVNWIVHEDGEGPALVPARNNDLFSCVDDGADSDKLADACARIGSLNDLNAEWTGGIFDATGKHFFVSVQHNVTGHGIILDITGWKRGERDEDEQDR